MVNNNKKKKEDNSTNYIYMSKRHSQRHRENESDHFSKNLKCISFDLLIEN